MIGFTEYARACLKIHSRHLPREPCPHICGIFGPHSVNVAHYVSLIRVKSPTNWDAHLAESNFQTRSKVSVYPKDLYFYGYLSIERRDFICLFHYSVRYGVRQ